MRSCALVLLASAALSAQIPELPQAGVEQMYGAVGAVFPSGATKDVLDAGLTVGFGGVHWLGPRLGVQAELGYDRIDPAPSLGDGAQVGQIFGLTVGLACRLHRGPSGLYLAGAGGVHKVRMSTVPDTLPVVPGTFQTVSSTRGGVTGTLGFEAPLGGGRTFFVEARWQRIYTRGQALDLVPLVVGTRF